MTSPPHLLSRYFFFNLIVKGPWCDRDDRRGDRIADVNDSRSLLSCHDLGTKGARTHSPFPYSSFSLLLLRFLPSRHREIRSRRRSAALKPCAGNGSRRPEAKCVRALSDRDGDGAVVLFLSRPCGLPVAYIRAGLWWRRICNWFRSSRKSLNDWAIERWNEIFYIDIISSIILRRFSRPYLSAIFH